ncbi:MAG: flagellar motility protein MotE (MotC chaperone) [Celeribacter sp.]|jgi:flagellar motility protein MotE (MotC chaperone)
MKSKAAPSPPQKVKRRRSGRGALLILAAVFTMSAGARLMSGTGAAIARELSQFGTEDTTKLNMTDASCEPDVATATLLASLQKRDAQISKNEKTLSQKMKAFDLARIEFTKNLAALQDAEKRLAATMTIASSAAQEDLDKLTAVYESMKPKDAAALFEQMSPDFAAGFLGRMRSDVAASVLAGLKPETAYTISVILAGRNASAPRE